MHRAQGGAKEEKRFLCGRKTFNFFTDEIHALQGQIAQLNVSFHFPSWFSSFLELLNSCYCRSVTKWCLTMQPHELQQAGLPCPSQSPGACLDSCLLVNYAIQPSVNSLSSCPQSFPASGSFPVSWLFASSGQGTRA